MDIQPSPRISVASLERFLCEATCATILAAVSATCISPLTIIGNLISILCFILHISASYLNFYSLTRDALAEIETFKQDLDVART